MTVAHSARAVEYTDCISVAGYVYPKEYPVYNPQQSDSEALVMPGGWEMWSTPLLPSIPGPLWPGVIASAGVLSVDQIELNYVLVLEMGLFWHLDCVLRLNWIVWNRTVFMYKNRSGINNDWCAIKSKPKPKNNRQTDRLD